MSRWKIGDLVVDRRCRQSALNFLISSDVGKRVPAVVEEEGAGGEASEGELRVRRVQEAERESDALGAGEDRPLFLPNPLLIASAEDE